MESISIKVFRGKKGFYEIKSDWTRIASTLKHKHLIHDYEWYKSYIDTLDDGDLNAIFLIMYRGSNPLAVFPIEERVKNILGLKFSILQIPHCRDIDIVDFIFDKNSGDENLMELFINNLEKCTGIKWNSIFFPRVLENSSIIYSLRNASLKPVVMGKVAECYYLNCDSYKKISSKFSKKFRKQLILRTNRLSQSGSFEYVTIRDQTGLQKAFDEFLDIEESGWKGRNGTAIRQSKDIEKFYRNLVDSYSEVSRCEIDLMRINETTVAASCNLLNGDTYYGLKTAYDNKYSKISPGILLIDHVIKRCAADPSLLTINMMSDYKWSSNWGPRSMDVYNIILFNKCLSGYISYYFIKAFIGWYRKYIKPVLWKYEAIVKGKKKSERRFMRI